MLLTRVLQSLRGRASTRLQTRDSRLYRRVLWIASVEELATLPNHYAAWSKDLLSERPSDDARFIQSVLRLTDLTPATYDAVYYSHQLKDYSLYEGGLILHGIQHVLKPGGFLHLKVPDVMAAIHQLVNSGHDLEDTAYMSEAGPISYHDILWGHGIEVANEGRERKGHRTGFSRKLLERLLFDNGFLTVHYIGQKGALELEVIAATDRLDKDYRIMLGLKPLDAST